MQAPKANLEQLAARPAFVAEISANHLGKKERAEALIVQAAMAGADAVKFQTFIPERLVGNRKLVIQDGPWKGTNVLELYREAWLPETWQPHLFRFARAHGVVPFSSPFSPEDVDFLEGVKCPIYKIASFEITDHDLIRYAAGTKKPLVISTGMATLAEIELAVELALGAGAPRVTVLKCTSGYPTPLEEANLRTVRDLIEYFGSEERIDVGLSDHSLGVAAAVAAIALGAVMIEKHITARRSDGGPDAGFSAEPDEFETMVNLGRQASKAIGSVHYGPTKSEEPQTYFRRALWVVANVKAGEPFTRSNLRPCRPNQGRELLPIERFLGRKSRKTVKAGTIFDEDMAA